jgi:hypothetical protein
LSTVAICLGVFLVRGDIHVETLPPGLGLGLVSSEKDVGLNKRSTCLAPGASMYLTSNLSFGNVDNSTAAISMRHQ